ncbi:MAG: hypothetical protein HQ453_08550 [Actinobacteria bacterium]|nr:hypothetical protein [Actinomycetota bacterium]
MRITAVAPFALLLVTALTAPAALAADGDIGPMLTLADAPSALGAVPTGVSPVTFTLPARGLELCDTALGSWQVQVAGPATATEVLIPTSSSGTSGISELAYVYPSEADAQKAWNNVRSAAKACDRTEKRSQPDVGAVTSTVTTGYFPGVTAYPDLWINHRDVYAGAAGRSRGTIARFSVFSQSKNAILVTSATSTTRSKGFSNEQREAIRTLAQKLSDRWDVR